ncbi:unnamed protein product [Natator depressus]
MGAGSDQRGAGDVGGGDSQVGNWGAPYLTEPPLSPPRSASPGRSPPAHSLRRRPPGRGAMESPAGTRPQLGRLRALRDVPDWSFVDGRPAPLWKGQTRRRQEDEAFARRVAMLGQEMERGLQRWQVQQRQQQEAKESKRQNQLQPKGATLRRGSPPQ